MPRWILSVGLLLSGCVGCAAGDSIWSRPAYQPAQPSYRGSQTYTPKTTVSPYGPNGANGTSFPGQTYGGGQSYGGSSSR